MSGAYSSHGPQDPKQSESKSQRKTSLKDSTFLGQLAYSVILHSWVSISPKVLIQVQKTGIGNSAALFSSKIIKGNPVIKTTVARESRNFGGQLCLNSRFCNVVES